MSYSLELARHTASIRNIKLKRRTNQDLLESPKRPKNYGMQLSLEIGRIIQSIVSYDRTNVLVRNYLLCLSICYFVTMYLSNKSLPTEIKPKPNLVYIHE
jgi:uncharacterized Zn-finger protein